MTLEHVAMAIVVVAVAVVAFLLGRARGVQLGEDEIDPNDPSLFGAQKNMSLFGGVGQICVPGRATFRHC